MRRADVLVMKYESLVSEWNSIFIASVVLFSSALLGFFLGLMFANISIIFISVVLMSIFAVFEHRSRRIYVDAKQDLEREIFKLAGMRPVEAKRLVSEGRIWD